MITHQQLLDLGYIYEELSPDHAEWVKDDILFKGKSQHPEVATYDMARDKESYSCWIWLDKNSNLVTVMVKLEAFGNAVGHLFG